MMIANDGHYQKCRWHLSDTLFNKSADLEKQTIYNTSPLTFFRRGMSEMRNDMLNDKTVDACVECHQVDQHNKVSGRQKQLLKAGITLDEFPKTVQSSPMRKYFEHSIENNGDTELTPLDWQIDLGNYCNSNCVMCGPQFSSSIATEYKKLNIISEMPPASWTTNSNLVNQFINNLVEINQLSYIHFLGGETVITPAFKTFLTRLIDADLNDIVTIGFTTNLTVWRQDIVDLLVQFRGVNLGVSVECLTDLNDYIRYPSKIGDVQTCLDQWINVANEHVWYKQIRITPTCLSISKVHTVYEYAYENDIAVESCNFLNDPSYLAINTLPIDLRKPIIKQLQEWIDSKQLITDQSKIVNTRHSVFAKQQILEDAQSYINYLKDEPVVNEGRQMIEYLKKLESSRNNKITDYLPEYEDYFRSIGY